MTIILSSEFKQLVLDQVYFIYKDKPRAAFKFRKDLISNIKKDLINPFSFQKSKYYNDVNIRDYVFKGYTSVYKIDQENKIVTVFGFIKHKESL
jgi:mRNA-degrading endonuclease RelE of RelBE toxin-antitoxin system